jgi:hypothetical protein
MEPPERAAAPPAFAVYALDGATQLPLVDLPANFLLRVFVPSDLFVHGLCCTRSTVADVPSTSRPYVISPSTVAARHYLTLLPLYRKELVRRVVPEERGTPFEINWMLHSQELCVHGESFWRAAHHSFCSKMALRYFGSGKVRDPASRRPRLLTKPQSVSDAALFVQEKLKELLKPPAKTRIFQDPGGIHLPFAVRRSIARTLRILTLPPHFKYITRDVWTLICEAVRRDGKHHSFSP